MYTEIIKPLYERIADNISKVIQGKEDKIRLLLITLLSGSHVLIDDVPGTGKTTLVKALSKSIAIDYKRLQCTPDLLPSDITGIHYFDQKSSDFVLRKGPVFTNILLADELNRTPPRTQSALLECMQEHQVTIDGDTLPLAAPFFVIATENPVESQGTFRLPEAELDRFFMKISMGYPGKAAELAMLDRFDNDNPLDTLEAVCTADELLHAMAQVDKIKITPQAKEYIVDIVSATRNNERILLGASPRATLALMKASRAHAAISGRDFVLPDDIKAIAIPVLAHRVILKKQSGSQYTDTTKQIFEYLLAKLPVPLK